MARIGLVSDTHGLLRPAVLASLQGYDQLIHAGDIGNPGSAGPRRFKLPIALGELIVGAGSVTARIIELGDPPPA